MSVNEIVSKWRTSRKAHIEGEAEKEKPEEKNGEAFLGRLGVRFQGS